MTEEQSHAQSVSRRFFMQLAAAGTAGVAALVALPRAGEGVLFPQIALADEGSVFTDDFLIRVLSPSTVGFIVADVSDPASPRAVANARITVTSAFNDETATAVTDNDGCCYIDIAALAENTNGVQERNVFECFATVELTYEDDTTAATYRLYEVEGVRLYGGNAFTVPTQKRDDKPYPSCLSVNGEDIAYTEQQFGYGAANDATHTCLLRLRDTQPGKTYEAGLYVGSEDAPRFSAGATSDASGTCEIRIQGQFFHDGTAGAFIPGEQIIARFKADETTYSINTKMTAVSLPFAALATQEDKKQNTIIPINFPSKSASSDALFQVKIPGIDAKFGLMLPQIPVHYIYNPIGFGMLSIGTNDFSLVSEKGLGDTTSWKKQSIAGAGQRWSENMERLDNFFTDKEKYQDKWKQPKQGNAWYGRSGITKKYSLDVGFQVVMGFYYMSRDTPAKLAAPVPLEGVQAPLGADNSDIETPPHLGFADVCVRLGISGSVTEQYLLGPFPFFITGKLGGKLVAGYRYNVSLKKVQPTVDTEDESTVWGTDHGITFTFTISLKLTVGIGVSGAVSASLSGGGALRFFVESFVNPPEGKADPHFVIGASAAIEFFVQALLLKFSGDLKKGNWPYLYSNWEEEKKKKIVGDGVGATGRFLLRSADGTGALAYSMPATSEDEVADGLLGAASTFSAEELAEYVRVVGDDDLAQSAAWEVTLPEETADGEPGEVLMQQRLGAGETGAGMPLAALKGVSADDVVVPASDEIIAKGVFSDPRIKQVVIGGSSYLLTISSVAYKTALATTYRSRVNNLPNGDIYLDDSHWSIDESLGFTRGDMFDYDFDVAALDDKHAVLLVTGGLRGGGASPTLEDVVDARLFSICRIAQSPNGQTTALNTTKVFSCNAMPDLPASGAAVQMPGNWQTDDTMTRMISCPRVTPMRIYRGGVLLDGALIAFVLNSAEDKDDVLTRDAEVTVELCVALFGDYDITAFRVASLPMDGPVSDINIMRTGINQAALSVFRPQSGSSVTTGRVDTYRLESRYETSGVVKVSAYRAVHGAKYSALPKVWPGRDSYLAARDGQLLQLSIPGSLNNKDFDTTSVDIDGFDAELFAVDNTGNIITYINNYVSDQGIDYETGKSAGTKTSYVISAARCMHDAQTGDAFCAPFDLAELDYPADMMMSASDDNSCVSLLVTTITDASKSLADIHAVAVPHVALVKPLSVNAEHTFVRAGAGLVKDIPAEPFLIEVKNIGNMCISGFTASLVDADSGEVVSSATVSSINPEEICLSMADVGGKNADTDELEDDEYRGATIEELEQQQALKLSGARRKAPANGGEEEQKPVLALSDSKLNSVLMPGEEMVYRVYLSVPKDWSGNKNVRLELTDFQVPALAQRVCVSGVPGDTQVTIQPRFVGDDEGQTAGLRFTDPAASNVVDGLLATGLVFTDTPTLEMLPEEELQVHAFAELAQGLGRADVYVEEDPKDDDTPGDDDKGDDKGDDTGGGDKPGKDDSDKKDDKVPSTGDSAAARSLGLFALGAGAAAFAAYSHRRESIARGEEGGEEQ